MSTQHCILNNTIMPIIFCIVGHIRAIVEHAREHSFIILVFSTLYIQVILLLYTLLCLKTFIQQTLREIFSPVV